MASETYAVRAPEPRRPRARSAVNALNLLALFAPGALFVSGLVALRGDPRFAWLAAPSRYPWQLWVVALAGSCATAAGVFDWRYHRAGRRVVSRRESALELVALACGLPLFGLMAAASVARRPAALLSPVVALALAMAALVCYDEFVFHRRCDRVETLAHRGLVLGNALAFLAWLDWCFARGAALLG